MVDIYAGRPLTNGVFTLLECTLSDEANSLHTLRRKLPTYGSFYKLKEMA